MSIKEDRLGDILSHVATKCGVRKGCYQKVDESEIIETYFSVLIPLTVTGVLEDKEIFRYIYVKLPTLHETARLISDYLWNTEVYVYNSLAPVWKRVTNMNIDELFPQCYYADATPNNQILVLKNMKCEGFQSYKGRFLNFEHVVVSLTSLAKFHALSYITRISFGHEKLSSLLKPYTDVYPMELNKAALNNFRTHSYVFKGSKYENYWEITLRNYKTIANSMITSKAKCLLYGHGDYWKQNIMFKYEANNPVKACILDFQSCQLMTPAYDFLYFILNSTNRSTRRLHYHKFVTEYHECFKNTLFDQGIQLELFYKREDFISDLKTTASLCFIRISFAFSLWLGLLSDTPVKSKNLWKDDQEPKKEICYFKELLTEVLDDLSDYGYISL